jgi:hypothetical protein
MPCLALTTVRVPGTYFRPVLVTAPPGDASRLFIVEQDGTIRIVKDGALLPGAFLDVSALTRSPADIGGDNEEGLLGLAFHPAYATNGLFFICHTDATGANNLLVRYAQRRQPRPTDPGFTDRHRLTFSTYRLAITMADAGLRPDDGRFTWAPAWRMDVTPGTPQNLRRPGQAAPH